MTVQHKAKMDLHEAVENKKHNHLALHASGESRHTLVHATSLQCFHDTWLLTFFNHHRLFPDHVVAPPDHYDIPYDTEDAVSGEEIHPSHDRVFKYHNHKTDSSEKLNSHSEILCFE